jgi:DNA-binding response OmpR family regulator/putative methionine-R-sulfoxide reductase with GAF domain
MTEQMPGILVVDDESPYREAVGRALAAEGLEWVEADGAAAALEAAADPAIGVVVLDVGLPDTDGCVALERLLALRPGLRVVMLSDVADQDRILDALRLGACDYLAKPIHDEELVLAVRRAADAFTVASSWTKLRGRLDRLVARMEEVGRAETSPEDAERLALLHEGIAQAASEVLEAEKTSLMALDPDGGTLRVLACVGRDRKPEDLEPVAAGEGISGAVLANGEPLLVTDVGSDPRIRGAADDGRYATSSFVVAPLIGASGPLGVLCATDRFAGDAFGAEDLALLRLLAAQSAALLAASRAPSVEADTDGLDATTVVDVTEPVTEPVASAAHTAEVLEKDEADALDRDAELARTICEAATDEVEAERVIEGALRPIGALLPAAPVSLFLLDPGDGELRKEGEHDGGLVGDRERLDRGRGLTGSVLQTGQVVATARPEADPRFDAEVDTAFDGRPRPYLCVPVKLRGKVVGVLRAFLPDDEEPSARTAEVLGAALSAAVRNALLYRSLLDAIEEVAEARRAARG